MSIQSTTRVSGPFVGDGSAVLLDFDFKVFDDEDIAVRVRDDATDIETVLGLSVDYIVDLNEDQDVAPGGRVTLTSPLAVGTTAHIQSTVDYLQRNVFTNTGGFYPSVLNDALDKAHINSLQLLEAMTRTLRVPVGGVGPELPSLVGVTDKYLKIVDGGFTLDDPDNFAATALTAAADAAGYAAALLTYTFGYIGLDDTVPSDVGEGEGFVYTKDGRVYGAINTGGVADVKFELFTEARATAIGIGTVQSVDAEGGTTGLTFSGGPVTGTGTLTLGGVLEVEHGGTGADNAASARSQLSAAGSGANTDITSIRESTGVASGGTIAASSVGFRGVPPSAQAPGTGITLALGDAGRLVTNTSGGWSIPTNGSVPFPVGTTIVLYNDSGSSQTVTGGSNTLRRAGTGDTGNRTVAQRGLATLVKVKSAEWIISGSIT